MKNDLIDRQAAIDAIKRAIWDKYTAKDAIDAVCNVPPVSVQPEPKKGRWIPNSPFTGNCSECGSNGNLKDNYCSSCGADMRGEK